MELMHAALSSHKIICQCVQNSMFVNYTILHSNGVQYCCASSGFAGPVWGPWIFASSYFQYNSEKNQNTLINHSDIIYIFHNIFYCKIFLSPEQISFNKMLIDFKFNIIAK